MEKIFKSLLLILFVTTISFAQQGVEKMLNEYTRPDEVVSMSANLPFNQAIELISKVSEVRKGKKIVLGVERVLPIGVEIKNMQYEKALMIIVQYANLIMEERDDLIIIKKKVEIVSDKTKDNFAEIDAREVRISAIFFEADIEGLKERGINWQFLLSKKGFDIGTGLTSTATSNASTDGTSSNFSVNTSSEFGMGSFFGEALALFKFIESEKLGEVIASPNITVRDGQEGKIQVGSDYSIKQRDFAGNVTDFFFQTGSIINVTPHVYVADGIPYTLLHLRVERSTGIPGEVSTEIRKTSATTQVLMLDGEETVIGGLFLNDEKTERVGIPFLKDLPWWVLGIRYLAGADKITVTKKELVILIKVELLPTLKERLANPNFDNKIKNEIQNYKDKIKYYKFENQN